MASLRTRGAVKELANSRRLAGEKELAAHLDAAMAALFKMMRHFDRVVLVGIHRRGVTLAERLAARIEKAKGARPPLGSLDINFYRDDLSRVSTQPVLRRTDIPLSLDDREVFLIDDVLYTGRTIRAALDALMDFGRPAFVRLLVCADRGGRELPICADWAAVHCEVTADEIVKVKLKEFDQEDGIYIEK